LNHGLAKKDVANAVLMITSDLADESASTINSGRFTEGIGIARATVTTLEK
jgi:hypothetical protein